MAVGLDAQLRLITSTRCGSIPTTVTMIFLPDDDDYEEDGYDIEWPERMNYESR